MKKTLLLLALSMCAQASNAAVSFSFSNSTNWLSNFQNGAGSSSDDSGTASITENRLVWGLIVDSAGDGFAGMSDLSPYDDGFSLASNTNGIQLNLHNSTATNDVLYIASAVMANSSTPPAGEGTTGVSVNRILSFTGLNFNNTLGVGQGDKFAIIWFDALTLGTSATSGMKYGIFTLPSGVDTLPADGSNITTLPSSFAGADASKPMLYTLGVPVPEASTSLLGAIGALALLRRRRN